MSRVRRSNTAPEMIVRRLLFSRGYRYRLNQKNLPGSPDIVFPGRKKAIFVHGCFWHAHQGCSLATIPKTRTEFWQAKFAANKLRDVRVETALHERGWTTLTIWQCETRDLVGLERRLVHFLTV